MTGAASGIGEAIATALIEAGALLCNLSRSKTQLRESCGIAHSSGSNCIGAIDGDDAGLECVGLRKWPQSQLFVVTTPSFVPD